MSLQTDNLAMVGLGVLGDQPPHPIQPILPDGIHLRWAFDPERGFPWHGYYLFRRPSREGKPTCIASQFGRDWSRIPLTSIQPMPSGTIESDVALAFVENIVGAGGRGFDLRRRAYLRFDLPDDRPARSFNLKLGFHDQKALREDRDEKGGAGRDGKGGGGRIGDLIGSLAERLLKTDRRPDPVTLRVTAFDRGTPVASADISGTPGTMAAAALSADRMDRIEVSGGPAVLIDLCFVPVDQDLNRDWGRIAGFPYPLCLPTAAPGYSCKGRPGGNALAESMALGRIRYGPPAAWSGARVTDLRTVLDDLARDPPPNGDEMAERTMRHSDTSGDPDQPAMPDQRPLDLVLLGAINPAVAQMVGLYWIDDPTPRLLLEPTANPDPNAAGVGNLAGPGTAPRREPEEKEAGRGSRLGGIIEKLKGKIRPKEEKVEISKPSATAPSAAYDYLLLADHSGRFHGEPHEALEALAAPLPDDVDGWICFNLRKQRAAPLTAPGEITAFALPSAATDPALIAQDLVNAAGLRWRIEESAEGDLLPGAAIGYHVWRASLGAAPPTAPPPIAGYAHLSTSGMVMVAAAPPPKPGGPERPSDWPPWPMHMIDGRLAEGWYSYRVAGMDIFGRISPLSGPAAWRQWAPEPAPRPWYYSGPPSNVQIHPFAVRLLVKTPPPAVPGVEAWALDPLDPDLAGEARYDAWRLVGWWNGLPASDRPKRAGLRVRWRWDREQMAQAPRTREFRIYLSPGPDPVPNHDDPLAWPTRVYAVNAATHFTPVLDANFVPTGDRQYEVLLPEDMTGQTFAGVVMEPTDLNPIVYAHVGVSAADDRFHAPDNAKWATGGWGNRPGNESRIGRAAKIFRVLRALPPAPPPIGADDKVWATRADYHGVSRYTFRWAKPAAGRKVHIFRAVDDALFRTDWERRRAAGALPIGPADVPQFGWNATDQAAVLAELGAPLDAVKPLHFDSDPAVRAAYEMLSERALRVLASLTGNDDAFVQTTFEPLDPADPANADRAGPDALLPYTPNPAWGAWTAKIDGKASNRYFFRAAYVNAAHGVGPLGPSSPAVYLPKVAPPRVPAITRVTSGELSITLEWAHNREPDFAEYRIYRADDERQARDTRLMARVATIAKADVDMTKAGVAWTDEGGLIGGRSYLYHLTSVDDQRNESVPSSAAAAIAVDRRPPEPPVWTAAGWLLQSEADATLAPWPPDGVMPAGFQAALELQWMAASPAPTFFATERAPGEMFWTPIAGGEPLETTSPSPGRYRWIVPNALPDQARFYRAVTRAASGIRSQPSSEVFVDSAGLEAGPP